MPPADTGERRADNAAGGPEMSEDLNLAAVLTVVVGAVTLFMLVLPA